MSDFGTGLREHLERSRSAFATQLPAPLAAPPPASIDVEAERRALDALRTQLAAKEFELAQREAELAAEQERMAHCLAKALLDAAKQMNVPPPLDELAVARARRRRW